VRCEVFLAHLLLTSSYGGKMNAVLELLKTSSIGWPALVACGFLVIIAFRFRYITIQIGEKIKIILRCDVREEGKQ